MQAGSAIHHVSWVVERSEGSESSNSSCVTVVKELPAAGHGEKKHGSIHIHVAKLKFECSRCHQDQRNISHVAVLITAHVLFTSEWYRIVLWGNKLHYIRGSS